MNSLNVPEEELERLMLMEAIRLSLSPGTTSKKKKKFLQKSSSSKIFFSPPLEKKKKRP
jgi:hypothetical protein